MKRGSWGWEVCTWDMTTALARRAWSLDRPGSRAKGNPIHDPAPKTGYSVGLGQPKLTDGGGRWHPRGRGGGTGRIDPESIRNERASDLSGGRILPAPGPGLGGSALPEPGQGTVSWRACLAFSSVHSWSLFSPLRAPGRGTTDSFLLAQEETSCPSRDRGPTFCLLIRSYPRTTPSLPSCP